MRTAHHFLQAIRSMPLSARLRFNGRPIGKKAAILLALVPGILLALTLLHSPQVPLPSIQMPALPAVGIEATTAVILDRGDYIVAKVTPSTPLLLNTASVEPLSRSEFQYRLRYTALEPGVFNLTDFLLNPLGGRLREPVVSVTVQSNIPADAAFPIEPAAPVPKPLALPYTLLLAAALLAWIGAGIYWIRPRKKAVPTQPPAPPAATEAPVPEAPVKETLASLLRPLVAKAANKSITSHEKAQLEQILFLYWGKQLALDHLDSAEQLRRILEHPEAGALLRTVEQWLYQPDSLITTDQINEAIAEYETLSTSDLPPPRPLPPPTATTEAQHSEHAA